LQTHPFRSPLFPGKRIIVDVDGRVFSAHRRELLGKVQGGVFRNAQGRVDEHVSRFVYTDLEPVIKKLRAGSLMTQPARRKPALANAA
jgi:hypothetical protein